MIDGFTPSTKSDGSDHSRNRDDGSTVRQAIECGARARDDDEVGGVEDLRITMPRGDFCKRIGADDEENLQWAQALTCNAVERVEGIRWAVASEFQIGGLPGQPRRALGHARAATISRR